jgi:hypothetical protein
MERRPSSNRPPHTSELRHKLRGTTSPPIWLATRQKVCSQLSCVGPDSHEVMQARNNKKYPSASSTICMKQICPYYLFQLPPIMGEDWPTQSTLKPWQRVSWTLHLGPKLEFPISTTSRRRLLHSTDCNSGSDIW